jgi:hypothetical protein
MGKQEEKFTPRWGKVVFVENKVLSDINCNYLQSANRVFLLWEIVQRSFATVVYKESADKWVFNNTTYTTYVACRLCISSMQHCCEINYSAIVHNSTSQWVHVEWYSFVCCDNYVYFYCLCSSYCEKKQAAAEKSSRLLDPSFDKDDAIRFEVDLWVLTTTLSINIHL